MESNGGSQPSSGLDGQKPNILVVGCGAIGGVTAAHLLATEQRVTVLSSNAAIVGVLIGHGFRVKSDVLPDAIPARAVEQRPEALRGPFDYVLLAVQPPQVEAAAFSVASQLAHDGRVVCFQNGLCEEIVARAVGSERVVGGVVAWGASMVGPGLYERTSAGGFTLGRLEGEPDEKLRRLAHLLEAVGPVELTTNLKGVRWSKLGINCAVSTLGTISGGPLGPVLKRRPARRLALEIISEVVQVARAEGISLQKVAGTLDLEWLALSEAETQVSGSPSLLAKHALILAVGTRYRRLRSSMLSAIERGRPPAIDFLNGEVVRRAQRHAIATPVNTAATEWVWQIARGERQASRDSLTALYQLTR